MKASEAKEILFKVSTIWTTQPTDRAVAAQWAESLSEVTFGAALETVRELANSGRDRPPTPGQVFALAKEIDDRRAEDERRARRKLEEPKLTDEERERRKALFRDLVAKVFGRREPEVIPEAGRPRTCSVSFQIGNQIANCALLKGHDGAHLNSDTTTWRPIDAVTMHAQEIIMWKRRTRAA